MNIYLCSTVRHLLFSLLKGLSDSDNKNIIFMITDQQNIDPTNFDRSVLPGHVDVIFITRKALRKHIYSGIKGNIIKQMANFNIKTSPSTRKKISTLLFNQALGLSLTNEEIEQGQLFLFNDRNKMSRLFRLAFERYTLIEEGFANYYSIKPKKFEVTLQKAGFPIKYRYFGSDSRCSQIQLLNPELAPDELKNKTHAIDFIHSKFIYDYCNPFFNLNIAQKFTAIIATQPLHDNGMGLVIYGEIIRQLTEKNIMCVLKPHPREDIQYYQQAFPNIPVIEAKVPLELVACSSTTKCNIYSVYSTAGLGFERYCQRVNLIHDDEQHPELLKSIMDSWKKNPDLIKTRLSSLIK
jgi:hypothetical protein